MIRKENILKSRISSKNSIGFKRFKDEEDVTDWAVVFCRKANKDLLRLDARKWYFKSNLSECRACGKCL